MVQTNFAAAARVGPLFTTDVDDLFTTFLVNLPAEDRQHYNCNACRRFINRFGGLVMISPSGKAVPLLSDDVSDFFKPALKVMIQRIESAKVTGVFLTEKLVLGEPVTGEWSHMSVQLNRQIFTARLKNADQAMAEKLEDYKMLISGLIEFPLHAVTQAVRVLEADALYRSEKVLGVAVFLKKLHEDRASVKNSKAKTNLVWQAVATAPAGFCHIKSSMIGTLLEDINAGLPFEDIAKKFADKMHPLRYQRPTAAPSVGNVQQAEKIVEKLGIENSLKRRFARFEDLETVWVPRITMDSVPSGGVFSKVKTKNPAAAESKNELDLPLETMTVEKFRKKVLPDVLKIEIEVPIHGGFTAFVTAEDMDAPPIVQWDVPEQRNPMSWYFYSNGSRANDWNLKTGWAKVTALCESPCHWFGRSTPNYPEALFFIIDGAKDKRDSGSALFPEILKSDLREIRSTIEEFSRTAKISGREDASAAGLSISKGDKKEQIVIRVTTSLGTQKIKLDRWD
jgi:hypothetical protein